MRHDFSVSRGDNTKTGVKVGDLTFDPFIMLDVF